MNKVELRGRFLGASAIEEVGQNGTKIRRFWVDVSEDPQYPNTPEFQLINDKCLLVDNLMVGMEVEVFGRLKGKKIVGKDGVERVYTNIDAWKVNAIQRTSAAFMGAAPSAPAATPVPAVATPGSFAAPVEGEKKDGLPF